MLVLRRRRSSTNGDLDVAVVVVDVGSQMIAAISGGRLRRRCRCAGRMVAVCLRGHTAAHTVRCNTI